MRPEEESNRFLMPAPGGLNNRLDIGIAQAPAEKALGFVLGGEEQRNVAPALRHVPAGDFLPGHLFNLGDDFSHGVAFVRAEVDEFARRIVEKPLEREDVRDRQVRDMDIVADGRPIGRREVGAANIQAFFPAEDALEEYWE